MLRKLALFVVMVLICRCVLAQADPKAAPKLPGDLAELLDGDENGQVSDEEARLAIEQFKKEANARQKTERGKMILAALDTNKDGKLDDAEAMQGAASGRAEKGVHPMVAHMFSKLDANRDGAVSAQEFGALQALLSALNPEAAGNLGEVFKAVDSNGDGVMTAVEAQLASDLLQEQGGGGGGFGGNRQPAAGPKENPKLRAYVETTFAQRDRNKDGLISEVEAKRDAALKREFAAADGNGNKNLTPGELYEYLEQKFASPALPK